MAGRSRALVGLAIALTIAYFVLPESAVAEAIRVVAPAIGAGAVMVGVSTFGPARAWGWRLLAASLLLEALYAWSWWRIPGDADTFSHHRRAIHYREHFVTNVATAGGLLLLQKIGAGRYTVDELLKKLERKAGKAILALRAKPEYATLDDAEQDARSLSVGVATVVQLLDNATTWWVARLNAADWARLLEWCDQLECRDVIEKRLAQARLVALQNQADEDVRFFAQRRRIAEAAVVVERGLY